MRNKVLTKEKLISIALDIIKKDGVEACTSRNIAEHANCALGTIYNYFKSQKEFLLEVFNFSWKNTEVKLQKVLVLDIQVEDKALLMFQIVNEDIKDRRGLGKFLFGSFTDNINNQDSAKKVLNNGNEILMKLLKESKKNSNFNEEELRATAKWIYFGVIALHCEKVEAEAFYKVIIDKFF